MHWNESQLNKILLVEDDPVHARIMRRALQDAHRDDQIVHLSDGESVLEALFQDEPPGMESTPEAAGHARSDAAMGNRADTELPQLILLDLQLPAIDGFEVLQAIRSHDRTRHIPVVIISTSQRPGDIDHSYALGANAYLTKPVDYTVFIEKLRSLREFWLETAELPVDNG